MDNIQELIIRRWSPVAFDSKPIEYQKINLLFEAAKWAPSGNNSQPWRFIYATNEMLEYGAVKTPTIMVDGRVKFEGRVPSIHEITRWIKDGINMEIAHNGE